MRWGRLKGGAAGVCLVCLHMILDIGWHDQVDCQVDTFLLEAASVMAFLAGLVRVFENVACQ
jgi:hypothetical protein